VKAGDAKPWVYHRKSGHDCQAAEEIISDRYRDAVCSAWLITSQAFLFGWLPTFSGFVPPAQIRQEPEMQKGENHVP